MVFTPGCAPAVDGEPEPAPTGAPPSASVSAMRADLLAALERLTGAPFRFTVTGGAPKGGTITASGSRDPAGKRFETTVAVTGTEPINNKRVVVGTDCYTWQPESKTWVHLDMARVRPDSLNYFDTADPTGLAAFITGIGTTLTVRSTPQGWTGQLRIDKVRDLPLGAPTFRRFGTKNLPFTVTADEQGLITTIATEVEMSSGPSITFTTTFTAHGTPVQINPPAKRDTREADDSYYT
jgi:hypothetical protein